MNRDGVDPDTVNEADEAAQAPPEGTYAASDAEFSDPGSAEHPQSEGAPEGDTVADDEAPEVDELAERTADLQRLSAEYANYRRRVARDKQVDHENATASVLAELLPVLDDLDRARQHGDLEGGPMRAVADKIESVITAQGVLSFGAEGDAFDPALHEAVQHDGDGTEPVIGSVYRKGYRLRDRVLRTAMVVVVDGAAPGADHADTDR